MIYLIVRKYKSQYSENYRIEKWAKTIKEANKFLSAITLLEDDDENVMHFIVPAQENAALILTDEVA
jgi:hypothetical protein